MTNNEKLLRELARIDREQAWIAWAREHGGFCRLLFVATRLFIGRAWRRLRGAGW